MTIYRLPFTNDPGWRLTGGNWDDPVWGHAIGDPYAVQRFSFDFVHDANGNGIGEAGQEVRAARAGKVVLAIGTRDYNNLHPKDSDPVEKPGEGNVVVIEHDDGTAAAYAHLQPNSLQVAKGQDVTRGALIALSGDTGNSTTPHLHFDVHESFSTDKDWKVTVCVHFEDLNHQCWRPRVGDELASNNG